MAAPFCTLQLADLGADVIKIENPDGGDQTRASGPFLEGESSSFLRLNRNKRSVALDLKAPRGKDAFRTLAARADVLVENLRPGTMKDLELDYPRLSELNPRLVYVAASAGAGRPYAQRPGLDIMAQGMSGLMSITGEEGGRNPVKVGVPVTDLTCALYGALAALAALRVRERTGRGQFIDVCLFESGVSLAVWEAGRFSPRGNSQASRVRAPDLGALPGAARFRRLLHAGRHDGPQLGGLLRRVRARGAEARRPLRQEPPAAPEPARADPASRGREREAARQALGRRAHPGGRPLRAFADLRPGLRRPAPCRARVLSRSAALEARPGQADRIPMRLSDTPTRMVRAGPLLESTRHRCS